MSTLAMKQAIEHRGDHEELVAIEGEQLSAVEGCASLVVSLKPKDHRAAEAVIFSDGKSEQWAAW
jgi:hypothetical protein